MNRLRLSLLLLVAIFSGCAMPRAQTGKTGGAALSGQWGGEHVGLSLSASGGSIQYDCAHGTLDAPVVATAEGAFAVPGQHVSEHGGPVRMGEQPESRPALYQGSVSGDRMQLRVSSAGALLGVYSLRRDASPQLFRCL